MPPRLVRPDNLTSARGPRNAADAAPRTYSY
jgi:hypothetical protein